MSAAREMTAEVEPKGDTEEWPKELDFVLSALEAGSSGHEQRRGARVPYRVVGFLKLYSDLEGAPARAIYTRDVCPRSLGFVTKHRLPLGYGGVVELVDKNGERVQLDCTLLRCREAAPGWFEGAMYFNRRQWRFSPEELT